MLQEQGYAGVRGITRHQLLVSPRVPYTSHNSAACLHLEHLKVSLSALIAFCRDYLDRESAVGADAGLCIAQGKVAQSEVQAFGVRAQREVLTQGEAQDVAGRYGVYLEGLTGTRDGIIGALAAVGLRQRGRGGRFIWVHGLRERTGQHMRISELRARTGVQAVRTPQGVAPASDDWIDLGPWPRPVLMDGQAVLLVEKKNGHDDNAGHWRVLSKEAIKRY